MAREIELGDKPQLSHVLTGARAPNTFTQGHVGLDFFFLLVIKSSFNNCILCLLMLSLSYI